MSETATINGQEVTVQPGETVLEAAARMGTEIPTLCYDGRVEPTASCRLCLVKVEGRRLPIAACAQALQPGMEVTTTDDDLDGWRKTLLNLTLSEVSGDRCLACEEQGPCELHSLAADFGATPGVFQGATSGQRLQDENPFIVRDYEQCIFCYRCTRVCDEVEQAHAIGPAGRGFESSIATAFETGLLESPCTFCGQCIQACPTGALMDKKMLGKAKVEEVEKVKTICPFCGTGCGIELNVADGKVIGVTPDWDSPVSQGSLCVKGQFGIGFINSPDRLTMPLIRKDGVLTESSWEEAYDLIASRFSAIKNESGRNAFAFWSSSRSTNESNYMLQKFARAVIGTNNVDNCSRT